MITLQATTHAVVEAWENRAQGVVEACENYDETSFHNY
jgi:hypothetical protein